MKQTALDLCKANLAPAKAKAEAARAKLRADFPEATEFAKALATELAGDASRPELPAFKPRIVRLVEDGREWNR